MIWTVAIAAALRDGRGEGPTPDRGLAQLSAERRAVWTERLQRDAADDLMPWDLANSGYSVDALRPAWSADHHATSTHRCLDLAVRSGDSDTVAARAGAELAARARASTR